MVCLLRLVKDSGSGGGEGKIAVTGFNVYMKKKVPYVEFKHLEK